MAHLATRSFHEPWYILAVRALVAEMEPSVVTMFAGKMNLVHKGFNTPIETKTLSEPTPHARTHTQEKPNKLALTKKLRQAYIT